MPKKEIEVVVTKLNTALPDSYFDYNKSYLPCNIYNKSENDLLDKILADRINDAGYQTRAGVVEAARFLTLEFPYRINYFYENGRLTKNGIDGEGRYYHTGLYLESSRYGSISASLNGPKAWGCDIYSTPAKRNIANGLDCSGFVTWALLNGGYDPKDIGAGITNITDLTDLGEVVKNSNSTLNRIKVGDLLHNNKSGGHIAILVGKDNDNYYVAQALWYDEIGVIITKHSKSNLIKEFPRVVLMDKYYKNDGNLSDYWK